MNIHMMGMNIVMSIMVTNMLMKRTFTVMSMSIHMAVMSIHMTGMITAMNITITNMLMIMDRTAPAAATIMITITTTMPMKFSQAGEKKLLMYSPEK